MATDPPSLPRETDGRLRRAAATASLSLAILLCLAKLGAAAATGSLAVLASLVDSLTDLVASAITFASVRIAQRPPDRGHRYGHGKAESLSALAQGALVAGSAGFILLDGIQRLIDPQPIAASGIGVAVMVMAILLTLGLVAFQRHVIRRTGSQAIAADSLHYRADLATNLAVMVVLSVVLNLLGANRFLAQGGLNIGALLVFSLVVGFTGSFVSLLMSKPMAKWSTGAQVIGGNEGSTERWLVGTVQRLAQKAGIGMPEVALYHGEPNAFATGAFRNSALVAVSTGLLQSMTKEEVEAVLGHEVAHIANGDMVTLTLIQGVVNTFVIFASRVVGHVVDRVVFRTEQGHGPGFWVTALVFQLLFGILASIVVFWFSRRREFRADAGGARLAGTPNMIAALERLRAAAGAPETMPDSLRAFGIRGGRRPGWMQLFASHPPLEDRIAALRRQAA